MQTSPVQNRKFDDDDLSNCVRNSDKRPTKLSSVKSFRQLSSVRLSRESKRWVQRERL